MSKQYRRVVLWLVTSCWKMDLSEEVLSLATAIVRSYLLRSGIIEPTKQQLLGSVSLLISCKYVTRYPALTIRWVCGSHHHYYSED